MFVSENLGINEKANLTIGGVDVVEIAKNYGTPLYVMDIDFVRKNCKKFIDTTKKYFLEKALVCFASKAFSCKEIYRIIKKENMAIDTVSLGEMYTAIKAGFPCEKIFLHGNNKTNEELEFAIENNIGRIVVDNLCELERIDEIAKKNEKVAKILLRINPGVDAHVHEYVSTGKEDSKFGFPITSKKAIEAVYRAADLTNVKLLGIHCHIGSQIFEIAPYLLATEVMMKFIKTVKEKTSLELMELNLGGGFAIKYTADDSVLDLDGCFKAISKTIEELSFKYGLKSPFLIIEPGRSIVGNAGITLYRVGSRKETVNGKIYLSIDGGMTDNPRYILYKSVYEAVVANKANYKKTERVSIAGKCCESGDLIGENILLQPAEKGDILAVLVTGAYNYSMSSNYNRNLTPAVVFVENKKTRIAVKRQTLEDLIRNDV